MSLGVLTLGALLATSTLSCADPTGPSSTDNANPEGGTEAEETDGPVSGSGEPDGDPDDAGGGPEGGDGDPDAAQGGPEGGDGDPDAAQGGPEGGDGIAEGGNGVCTSDAACAAFHGPAGPCERAACIDNTCTFVPEDAGTSCQPEDKCQLPGTCVEGTCESEGAVVCESTGACTLSACDADFGCTAAPLSDVACEDGDPCTLSDTCDDGGCIPGEPLACDDADPCTVDSACSEGSCPPPAPLDCDDDDPCTLGDTCADGDCVQGEPLVCDDGDPCTTDPPCTQGTCPPPLALDCDDDDLCTTGGGCVDGTCVPPAPVICDDGDACTEGDLCVDGECVFGEAPPCDDGNGCTESDACEPATGACVGIETAGCVCDATSDCGDFEDESLCNGVLVCSEGQCVVDPETVVACEDPGSPCLIATCDPGPGTCSTAPLDDGSPCEDGDGCTSLDACFEGTCEPGALADCDDGNPCTVGELCADGACVDGTLLDCEDGDPCTIGEGCLDGECGEPTPLECDDADPCTTGDACVGGKCLLGVPIVCADGDPCTEDPACAGGTCGDPVPVDCEDGSECTQDACVDGFCQHVFDSQCNCEGLECPPEGEYGDALVLESSASSPVETTGVEIVDGYAITCGGFGLRVLEILPTTSKLSQASSALSRCQHIAPAMMTNLGKRTVYASHHGDAYVPTPGIYRLSMNPDSGSIQTVQTIALPGENPDGLAWDPELDVLWVANHVEGIRRYPVLPMDGTIGDAPELLVGFENAIRLELAGPHVLVAEGGAGLKVLDRVSGEILGAAETAGFAKDVAVVGTMALVAASTAGVQAFDISDPTDPQPIKTLFTFGSAHEIEVFAGGTRAAVANVDDVLILDVSHPDALKVLAVDRGTDAPAPPRNLALAAEGDLVISGEWLGPGVLRWYEGLLAPELHLGASQLQFGIVPAGQLEVEQVLVTNRGWLPLDITEIGVTNASSFSVSPTSMHLQPGEDAVLDIFFTPASTNAKFDAVHFVSNDPDESIHALPLLANLFSGSQLTVGHSIDKSFDFLDVDSPPGEQSWQNLQGHPLVLGYFATF